MFPKLAAVVVGAGAIGIGGVAFAKPEWLGINGEISWTPLSQDKDYKDTESTDPYKDKFGSTYKDYLVGAVGKERGKDLNKRMWEKLFGRLEDDNKTEGKFKRKGADPLAVTTAYSDDTATALNKVCDDAYKTAENSFGTDNSTFNKDDVWKYCSPGVLVKVDASKQSANTIGKDDANAKILVSTKSPDNDWFWKIRNEDFWKDSGTWSGSGASDATGSNEKSIFKDAYTSQRNNGSERITVKKLCEDAYKKSNNSTHNSTDAKKFCQLEKTN